MPTKIRELLWTYAATVAALILFVIVSALYFGTSWLGSDLGGNLFAEAFGIFFTVVFIEQLIRANAKRQTRTSRFAAYHEANRLLTYLCVTWSEIVKSTVQTPPPMGSDLFGQPFIDEVVSHFDLTSIHGGIFPEQSWRTFLSQVPKSVREGVNEIISRYQIYIDPTLLNVLLKVEKLPFILVWGQFETISQYGGHSPKWLPVPQDLAAEFEVIRELQRVLAREASEFRKMEGFMEPFDVSFQSAIQLMHSRTDLGPKIGSSRR